MADVEPRETERKVEVSNILVCIDRSCPMLSKRVCKQHTFLLVVTKELIW